MSDLCQECERLKRLYCSAVERYGKAVEVAVNASDGPGLRAVRQMTLKLGKSCESLRSSLADHIRQDHGPDAAIVGRTRPGDQRKTLTMVPGRRLH
jgi:hypothetical protein